MYSRCCIFLVSLAGMGTIDSPMNIPTGIVGSPGVGAGGMAAAASRAGTIAGATEVVVAANAAGVMVTAGVGNGAAAAGVDAGARGRGVARTTGGVMLLICGSAAVGGITPIRVCAGWGKSKTIACELLVCRWDTCACPPSTLRQCRWALFALLLPGHFYGPPLLMSPILSQCCLGLFYPLELCC